MRLPDWVYARLERAYVAQRRLRQREVRDQAAADDRALRAWADRTREAHRVGMCGGAAAGCPFVPCVPVVNPW